MLQYISVWVIELGIQIVNAKWVLMQILLFFLLGVFLRKEKKSRKKKEWVFECK